MRNLKIFTISLVILTLFFTPIMAESELQDVDVSWTLSGCWIDLNASDAFEIEPENGSTYNIWQWSPGYSISDGPHNVNYPAPRNGAW